PPDSASPESAPNEPSASSERSLSSMNSSFSPPASMVSHVCSSSTSLADASGTVLLERLRNQSTTNNNSASADSPVEAHAHTESAEISAVTTPAKAAATSSKMK